MGEEDEPVRGESIIIQGDRVPNSLQACRASSSRGVARVAVAGRAIGDRLFSAWPTNQTVASAKLQASQASARQLNRPTRDPMATQNSLLDIKSKAIRTAHRAHRPNL